MYVHQTGLVWKAVCASMTIAAMLPPLLINGELHVDGGYINNLPVDVMAEAYHAPGLMVAVDVENKSVSLTVRNVCDAKEIGTNTLRCLPMQTWCVKEREKIKITQSTRFEILHLRTSFVQQRLKNWCIDR